MNINLHEKTREISKDIRWMLAFDKMVAVFDNVGDMIDTIGTRFFM